jgi:hypothetical protein
MSAEELRDIFTMAILHIWQAGVLGYIERIPDQDLLDAMPGRAELRSLGLSSIPGLLLNVIAEFIRNKAARVEIIALLGTSPELVHRHPRQTSPFPVLGAGAGPWRVVRSKSGRG